MKKAKAIMIQGTMSNAGKSLLAAGLCRIFRQDGYRVAPFKSQNMALNSYITADGLEMGRAQVMQAEAAGIAPEVRMNPILLKPTTDTGSQVIVNGEVLGNMSAREYFAHKSSLIPDVMKAYDSLAAEYDIIVLEGAGSPAEINLKDDDIVNMGMARLAKAPVLLAGDIDRGGVFAQLLGTQMLLEDDEKAMLKGLIINKFRGDESILTPGVRMLEARCGIPVVGVVPYMTLDVDDEDSLSERLLSEHSRRADTVVDIAVIRLPHIANFTDFNALSGIPGTEVRYVRHTEALGHPDLIILPGTKNTMDDLRWLRQSGLEAAILRHASGGGAVLGICGGYQMLGDSLEDPYQTEEGGAMRGMQLLPMRTVFAREKTRTRVSGRIGDAFDGALASMRGLAVEGYEIHMGRSEGTLPFFNHLTDAVTGDEKRDGFCRGDVYGTYVHGFFDKEGIAAALAEALAARKGMSLTGCGPVMTPEDYKNSQYDLLAEGLRAHLDMAAVYRILEEGLT